MCASRRKPEDLHAVRIAAGGADLLLGCDMVVAASPAALSRVENGVTRAVVNSYLAPTAAFVINPDIDFETLAMQRALKHAAGDGGAEFVDGTDLATALMGDSASPPTCSCWATPSRRGWCRWASRRSMRAIELNGVAVEANKRTFAWGRLAAARPRQGRGAGAARRLRRRRRAAPGLAELVEHRAAVPDRYQNAAYAARYRDAVAAVEAAEKARAPRPHRPCRGGGAQPLQADGLQGRVRGGAALHRRRFPARSCTRQFEGDFTLEFHLAPPLFAKRDPATGELKKRGYGPWMLPRLPAAGAAEAAARHAASTSSATPRSAAWSGS